MRDVLDQLVQRRRPRRSQVDDLEESSVRARGTCRWPRREAEVGDLGGFDAVNDGLEVVCLSAWNSSQAAS